MRAHGRRDRQGRAGPGGGAGPPARPAAHRRAARLVRAPRGRAPGWYRASGDPIVGQALRLLHHSPEHPWTVAELAGATGVSRAALARRFNDLVGEPPMSFSTGWRIALAADLLREPGATIGSVAAPRRLRQLVRAQHRVQARPRRQPAAAPLAALAVRGPRRETRGRGGPRGLGAAAGGREGPARGGYGRRGRPDRAPAAARAARRARRARARSGAARRPPRVRSSASARNAPASTPTTSASPR